MNELSFFKLKDKFGHVLDTLEIVDRHAREMIPTKTSDLQNDSGFVASNDLAAVATSGSYNDLLNKPTIPVISSEYSSPFNKVRIGEKAIVYGTTETQSVAVTSNYQNVAYYADVTISVPSAVRLSSVANVQVQTLNGLGLVAVDILEVSASQIKVRVWGSVSETISMQFSVTMFGDN